jgi:hypothetical protein
VELGTGSLHEICCGTTTIIEDMFFLQICKKQKTKERTTIIGDMFFLQICKKQKTKEPTTIIEDLFFLQICKKQKNKITYNNY